MFSVLLLSRILLVCRNVPLERERILGCYILNLDQGVPLASPLVWFSVVSRKEGEDLASDFNCICI